MMGEWELLWCAKFLVSLSAWRYTIGLLLQANTIGQGQTLSLHWHWCENIRDLCSTWEQQPWSTMYIQQQTWAFPISKLMLMQPRAINHDGATQTASYISWAEYSSTLLALSAASLQQKEVTYLNMISKVCTNYQGKGAELAAQIIYWASSWQWTQALIRGEGKWLPTVYSYFPRLHIIAWVHCQELAQ